MEFFIDEPKKQLVLKLGITKAINLLLTFNQRVYMKLIVFVIFFGLIAALNYSAEAQNDFAKLEKNVNLRAKGLVHKLNATKDTLILKSKSPINKVYSVSMDYTREVDMTINATSAKIPLTHLTKGKHVFVAVQSPIRIVFVVKVLREQDLLVAVEEKALLVKNRKE